MRFHDMMNSVLVLTLTASMACAAESPRAYTGPAPQLPPELRPFVRVTLGGISGYGGASQAIQDVLALERRTTSVDQAMQVKRSGLMAATTLDDFLALASYAFSNPSDAYRAALSRFIAQNVASRITPVDDLSKLLVLEARTTTVDDAMAVKAAALVVVHDLPRFEMLTRNAFSNASDAYRAARSRFLVQNIAASLPPGTDLTQVLSLEARTSTVDDAMGVKAAALVLVHGIADYEVLTRNAFSNPTSSYLDARARFITNNIGRGLTPDASLDLVRTVEARTLNVDQAIAVKTAALIAVHSREDLMSLARSAFSNPSADYLRRVGEFVAHAAGNLAPAP